MFFSLPAQNQMVRPSSTISVQLAMELVIPRASASPLASSTTTAPVALRRRMQSA